jgi:drug/metabolite transporter (DMT)-like permease
MRRTSGILWITAAAVLWGTDTVLRRPLTDVLQPVQLVFYEHAILGLAVLPILWRSRRHLSQITGRTWAAIFGMAWIGSALSTVLFTQAVQSGSPTTAVLLQKTQPLFAIGLARSVLGERWPARFLTVAAIAVVGAYFVAFGDGNWLSPWRSIEFRPAVLALAAAAGWGFSTVWGRITASRVPFELITTLRVLCALPVLLAIAAFQGEVVVPATRTLPPLLWLALVPGFAALMFYYHGLRTTAASEATIAELAFPITAWLLNWLVLGVAATSLQLAGFTAVWLAIFTLHYNRRTAVVRSESVS